MATVFTTDQKRGYVQVAQRKGRKKAAKAAGVSPYTISSWARELGLTLPRGAAVGKTPPPPVTPPLPSKPPPPPTAARTNGHHRPNGIEAASVPSLDAVRDQLLSALQTVEAMRTSLRQAFGVKG